MSYVHTFRSAHILDPYKEIKNKILIKNKSKSIKMYSSKFQKDFRPKELLSQKEREGRRGERGR